MTDGSRKSGRFFDLLGAVRDGTATNDQLIELNRLLDSHPRRQKLYVEYMLLCAELHRHHGASETCEACGLSIGSDSPPCALVSLAGGNGSNAETILADIIEQDRQAAEEEAQLQAETRKESIRRVAEAEFERFKEREHRRQEELAHRMYLARRRQLVVSAFAAIFLLSSAILLWISHWQSHRAPSPATPTAHTAPATPPIVGRITQSIGAKWQGQYSAKWGTPLRAVPMFLTEGLVELAFEGGTTVLLQAPVSLQPEATDRMFLRGGAISVKIAEDSEGFVVRTPTGTVVDYGTEFGVLVNQNGETEALVYKGKVGLRSGSDPVRSVVSRMLTDGQAGAVDTAGNVVSVEFSANRIMRDMPDALSFGIPGKRLDLADVIGGGNGFGTGIQSAAISPLTGELVRMRQFDRSGIRQYVLVPWNRYVDGVFVPDGEASRTVSSAGHAFADCPATNNILNMDITNVGNARCDLQKLSRRTYGSARHPCILMHANVGITFDLAQIASANPGLRVIRFRSGIGVSESGPTRPNNADFWVLVDGEPQFKQLGVKSKGRIAEVDVELAAGARFLTLITTDGGDPDGDKPPYRATDSDWCVFAEPYLELAPAPAREPKEKPATAETENEQQKM